MSLVSKLRPHVEDLKVHKQVTKLSPTEQRLNQMTAIILNKRMDPKVKDRLLKDIVSESRVEKALKERGITVSLHSSPEVRIQRHDHR
jgi:hypothetical protein